MNNKQIISACKSQTHLDFIVKVSYPLNDVSEELANDVCNMFTQSYQIPVTRYLNFTTNEEGKERFIINVEPNV